MSIKEILNYLIILPLVLFILGSCTTFSKNSDEKKAEEVSIEEKDIHGESVESQNIGSVDQKPVDIEVFTEKEAAIQNEKIKNEDVIEVIDRIFFAVNSKSISEESKNVLKVQSDWLKSESEINVIVEGHCDERGTREYNIALGEKRAEEVKNYLLSLGVEASRVKTISYGKEKPEFLGGGEEVWTKNRRAVVVVPEIESKTKE